MTITVIGNVIVLIGAVFMVAAGFIKNRKNILLVQCLQFTVMGLGNLILGGVSGFISNVVGVIRNVYCLNHKLTTLMSGGFIALQAVLTFWLDNAGIKGWLPVIAALIFTLGINTRDEIILKSIIIVCQILWCIYDISNKNMTGFAFDLVTIFTNIAGIVAIVKYRKTGFDTRKVKN